jgi:hypothetical protein
MKLYKCGVAFRIFIVTLLISSCAVIHGKDKITYQNIHIYNEVTGESVDSCLIVPIFSKIQGITSGAGHGPGKTQDRNYISDPFIYKKGMSIDKYFDKGCSVILLPSQGWLFIGKLINLSGILVISNGYLPLELCTPNDMTTFLYTGKLYLKPIDGNNDETDKMNNLKLLLQKKYIEEENMKYFCSYPIENRFTENDYATVNSYLSPP